MLEVVARIRKGEKLCTKAVEFIPMMREVLLEDETREKIKESGRQVDEKITRAKLEMKKLSLKERVTKIVEIKQLQQEFQALSD